MWTPTTQEYNIFVFQSVRCISFLFLSPWEKCLFCHNMQGLTWLNSFVYLCCIMSFARDYILQQVVKANWIKKLAFLKTLKELEQTKPMPIYKFLPSERGSEGLPCPAWNRFSQDILPGSTCIHSSRFISRTWSTANPSPTLLYMYSRGDWRYIKQSCHIS